MGPGNGRRAGGSERGMGHPLPNNHMHARRQSRSARKMATSLKLMSEKAIAVALFSDASILAAAAHRHRAPMRDLATRAGSGPQGAGVTGGLRKRYRRRLNRLSAEWTRRSSRAQNRQGGGLCVRARVRVLFLFCVCVCV